MEFIYSQRGHPLLVYKKYVYCKNRNRSWRCIRVHKSNCKSHLLFVSSDCVKVVGEHSHGEELERISQARKIEICKPETSFNDSKIPVIQETELEMPKIKEEPIEAI